MLSRDYDLSLRQAYRYLEQAQAIGHRVPTVEPSQAITMKLPEKCHSRFARILRGKPIDLGRDCGSGTLGVFDEDATPWVSEWQLHAPFTSNPALIVCTPPSLNRSTRFSFPTAFASRASTAI